MTPQLKSILHPLHLGTIISELLSPFCFCFMQVYNKHKTLSFCGLLSHLIYSWWKPYEIMLEGQIMWYKITWRYTVSSLKYSKMCSQVMLMIKPNLLNDVLIIFYITYTILNLYLNVKCKLLTFCVLKQTLVFKIHNAK